MATVREQGAGASGGGASVPVTNCNDDGAGSLRDAVEATPRPAR
jgi:hypothetical protein